MNRACLLLVALSIGCNSGAEPLELSTPKYTGRAERVLKDAQLGIVQAEDLQWLLYLLPAVLGKSASTAIIVDRINPKGTVPQELLGPVNLVLGSMSFTESTSISGPSNDCPLFDPGPGGERVRVTVLGDCTDAQGTEWQGRLERHGLLESAGKDGDYNTIWENFGTSQSFDFFTIDVKVTGIERTTWAGLNTMPDGIFEYDQATVVTVDYEFQPFERGPFVGPQEIRIHADGNGNEYRLDFDSSADLTGNRSHVDYAVTFGGNVQVLSDGSSLVGGAGEVYVDVQTLPLSIRVPLSGKLKFRILDMAFGGTGCSREQPHSGQIEWEGINILTSKLEGCGQWQQPAK